MLLPSRGVCEGSKELNSNNNQSTELYICNDFAAHCTSSAGLRSQFAAYDDAQSAADVDRLYFKVKAGEAVYFGFRGGGITNPASPARHIVYRIKDFAGGIAKAEANLPTSGTGFITNLAQANAGPNQLLAVPGSGYDAIVFTPAAAGTYYIEFSIRRDDNSNIYVGHCELVLFDLTVATSATLTPKPGRLYSKCWQFYETANYYGTNYVISNDSIITSTIFSNMSGGHWNQYCNQTGCGNDPNNWLTSRKSLPNQQALYPDYKIFLNSPDPELFPPAVVLGAFVAPMPYGVQDCLTGHILFHIKVNKPGNVELTLTFPSPYQPRVYNTAVVTGDNTIDWDGYDGTSPVPLLVPNNTPIQFTVEYINGLTNLPLYDVEANTSGFTVGIVSPAGAPPSVFWDDTSIPGGTSNTATAGCVSPPACHPWSDGDLHTMNTWWFNVSTSTAPATVYVFRGPANLSILQEPPQAFCANTGNHVFSVTPDPNTDVYHWSYTPSTGVTINQLTPGSYQVTVTFGPGATSGTLSVYGSNTNCNMNSQPASLPITIYPLPTPTIAGPASACTGQTGVTYTTEAGKNSYQWVVSAGGLPTAGGGPLNNFVTVTWLTAGPQTVSVNYQNPVSFCAAATPTVKNVTVHSRPVPTLGGPSMACIGSTVTYTTEAGQSSYAWNFSSGGALAGGGTSTSNTISITWGTVGLQWVTVSYTDPVTGCQASVPIQLDVTVNTLPSPSITGGPGSACVGVPGNVYSTQTGMTNYSWTVTGGTITSGGGFFDPTATVTWNTTGPQSISVNYAYIGSTCASTGPATMPVTVKPLPVPSFLSGPFEACEYSSNNTYMTQPGMQGYVWTISGGFFSIGGGPGDAAATVTWTTPGTGWVAVNYTDPATGCTAVQPVIRYVTVYALPVPSFLSGDLTPCLNSPGHVYTTQSGMTGYSWTITGGDITLGGGNTDASATVTWTATGPQSLTVSYTDPVTGCTALIPTPLSVNVLDLPVPTFISGEPQACKSAPGHTYVTQPGMTAYTWSLTGGTITAFGNAGDDRAVVTWNTAGPQTISVGYTDPATTCTAAAPAVYSVTVHELPVPTITGPAAACLNVPGSVYSTEANMSGYTWTVPGGTVTPGPTPDIISVTWTSTGPHTMSVTYTDNNGCTPAAPTTKLVNVNLLPVPGLTGQSPVCTGIPTVYSTETGMSGYTWSVSPGGTITLGGQNGDATATVVWNTAGPQHVYVNYALGTGCTAAIPTDLPVTVNTSTPPVITQLPDGQVCATATGTYTTQASMNAYAWTVSPGGTPLTPLNGNTITVLWNTPGPQWVSVNFTNNESCRAPTPTVADLTVNPLPVTSVTAAAGPDCDAIPHLYSNPPDPACTFTWSILPAAMGSVSAGQGTSDATILWQFPGQATVGVAAVNNTTGCTTSASVATTVYPRPNPQFTPCFDLVTTPGARKIILRGATPFLPGQGVYSGNRVSLNAATGLFEFNPTGASPGAYPVVYTYTNTYGCPASPPSVTITVQAVAFTCGSLLTDVRDGRQYATSLIGGKCWMKEDLAFGTGITAGMSSTDNCIEEKYCPPGTPDCESAAGHYQWDEVMRYGFTYGSQGICPPEWHVPAEAEWMAMQAALEPNVNPPDGVAGSFLKDPYPVNGFRALLSGLLYYDRLWSYNSGDVTGTMYWTSAVYDASRVMARGVNNYNPSTSRYPASRADAFPVRCVKD